MTVSRKREVEVAHVMPLLTAWPIFPLIMSTELFRMTQHNTRNEPHSKARGSVRCAGKQSLNFPLSHGERQTSSASTVSRIVEDKPWNMTHLASSPAHRVPKDLRGALSSSPKVVEAWNALTPLARNEWICWTISVKKPETRAEHIRRLTHDITHGKRRPCCWPGCPHRKKSGV